MRKSFMEQTAERFREFVMRVLRGLRTSEITWPSRNVIASREISVIRLW
jgi:hypothetical protein